MTQALSGKNKLDQSASLETLCCVRNNQFELGLFSYQIPFRRRHGNFSN